jgi:mitotic spindle assembly checkpoint protein MAD2
MGTARDVITLKGSAAIVSEFLCYAVNSILFQRGIYPSEEFSRVKKYGMTLLICQQENVKAFIETITAQLSNWLEAGNLERAVLVIASISTKEVLERWNFTIETDTDAVHKGVTKEKSDKEIMTDIQAIMRQIASSVTFLPNLAEACTFDLLAYTSVDSKVPPTWGDSDARLIHNPQIVKLRSIDTKVHQVEALVAYKFNEEV